MSVGILFEMRKGRLICASGGMVAQQTARITVKARDREGFISSLGRKKRYLNPHLSIHIFLYTDADCKQEEPEGGKEGNTLNHDSAVRCSPSRGLSTHQLADG